MSQEKEYIVWVRCSVGVPHVVKASSPEEARQELEDSIENGDLSHIRTLNERYYDWDGPDDDADERTVVRYDDYFATSPELH